MAPPMRLGIGAAVSFKSQFIHPHNLRDEHFPDRHSGHRLIGAIVVGRQQKYINHKNTTCVIVHHAGFVDDDGIPQDLWCAENHVKVHREGDPHKFFDVEKDTSRGDNDEDSEDVENLQINGHYRDKHKSIDPHGFDDPLRPREGRDLMWRNVNMTLSSSSGRGKKSNEPDKKILDNVWGDVPSKQMTAIMGPSGAL